MDNLMDEVKKYVAEHIGEFHGSRLACLEGLKLDTVLRKKNPYLFRVKDCLTSEQIIRSILDAFVSSHEETVFGNWLERLAVFVCEKAYHGFKSGIPGIDLEFKKDEVRYIVSIKSGPNWGNAAQIQKMISAFTTAKKTLRTSGNHESVIAVNGCCYGREQRPDKGNYFKCCGQQFWTLISGNPELYKSIIQPLGHEAEERNRDFNQEYAAVINRFTLDFSRRFCLKNGHIDWDLLLRFNSESPIALKDIL